MHSICTGLGFTERKQADRQTALEITAAFRIIAPEDPVRYDFCLTRLGIRRDAAPGDLIQGFKTRKGNCIDGPDHKNG
jgi:hypothetical protein